MDMSSDLKLMFRLAGIASLLETEASLDEGLKGVANFTAHTLKADRCSIMLLSETDERQPGLRLFTHYGNIPDIAYQMITQFNDGIAGYVASTGTSLLIPDINKSKFAVMGRYLKDESNKSLISTPIYLTNRVIGVINVSGCRDRLCFQDEDLEILKISALFVGKSIHITQLQTMMRSQFVERAVLLDWQENQTEALEQSPLSPLALTPDPGKLAKIVAKSFFKELTQAGFSANQIIAIATEVLNLLQSSLNKHKKRIARDEE
jgi:L-methionine (R)-S-oxide reductase